VTVFTIGHSTRSIDEFLRMLKSAGVAGVADVRRFPGSRRHPQFAKSALADALADAGITYRHLVELGGRRVPLPSSINTGWRNTQFRGYADHMHTPDFRDAVDELVAWGEQLPVAVMCAEALPWRCHRWLLADALVSRGVDVKHIMDDGLKEHHLTPFARIVNSTVIYPRSAEESTDVQGSLPID